jgi:hypothetical protein
MTATLLIVVLFLKSLDAVLARVCCLGVGYWETRWRMAQLNAVSAGSLYSRPM